MHDVKMTSYALGQPSSCMYDRVVHKYNHDYVYHIMTLNYKTGAVCWKSCLLC